MKNKKVIVINGFQRGGTNIVYNIFQSHPMVCSPYDLETGQIISQNYRIPNHKKIGYVIKRLKLRLYSLLNKKIVLNSFLVKIFGIIIDELFYKYKLKNYDSQYNRFKYEHVPYSLDEIKNSVLCLKSVHNEISLTNFLSRIYNDIFFISLLRNGYALCEGWIRRGKSAQVAGIRYKTYCEMFIKDIKKTKNYKIVKFEDIIKDPFGQASELYKFTKLNPPHLKKLRFKSKKILMKDGKHEVKYGKEDTKYWLDNATLNDLFDQNINQIQINNLSESDKKSFEKEAKSILDHFHYTD